MLGVATTISLVSESRGYRLGGEAITSWGFQNFGLVEYYGQSSNFDPWVESPLEFSTVLQFGPVRLLLAKADIYYTGSLVLIAAVLFFSFGLRALQKVPAFGLWLQKVVTARNLVLSILVCTITGTSFVMYWFSPPHQWRKIRAGMSEEEVFTSMPDWVWDKRCTDHSYWIVRDRYLCGMEKHWLMRVTFDREGQLHSASTASSPLNGELPFSPDWTEIPLPQ